MSQILLNPLPPLCAEMGATEFPQRLFPDDIKDPGRALNVGLLNLMPTKDVTERQWLRLLLKAEHPYPLKFHLLKLASWRPTHANPLHMARYYTTVESVLAENKLDALIITGAPLGRIDYAAVGYWKEFTTLMAELEVRAIPTLFSCWAAQAALHQLYQVPTLRRQVKLSGVFPQQLANAEAAPPATRRLIHSLLTYQKAHRSANSESAQTSVFSMPQSRFAMPDPNILQQRLNAGLSAVLAGEDTGISVLTDDRRHRLFLLGHPEYEEDTLAFEYSRDLAQDPTTQAPRHYQLPVPSQVRGAEDKTQPACNTQSAQWQALGALLLQHWLGAQSQRR